VAQRIAKEADEAARRQDFNLAIPKYKAAIEYYPEFTEALFNLSKTFYRLDDIDNAKIYLLKNLSVNEKQSQSLKMLADIYKKERNTGDAIKYYNKAINVKADYYQAYYSLGILLIRTDINLAKEKLSKAIEIRNDYYKAHETLGIVNMQLFDYDQALENFKNTIRLLEKKPPRKRSYKSFYLSSQIYLCLKDFKLAKEYAKGALDIKSNCAPAYLYLGIAEKNLNNRPAAMDAFTLAKSDKDWRESANFEIDNYDKDTSANIGCKN
jgi:tetratricopeptide (TPR) repeat protein